VGCHLVQTGLFCYSLNSLKNREQYWFSFFKAEKEGSRKFFLKKETLLKRVFMFAACPLFPDETTDIIKALPATVNLHLQEDDELWIPTKYRIRTRWLSRFPPIVPKSEAIYKNWIRNLLLSGPD
jgi:hypothetical protein